MAKEKASKEAKIFPAISAVAKGGQGIASADTILEAMIDGVGVLDIDGNFIQSNAAFAKMFGYKGGREVIGSALAEIIAEREIPRVMAEFEKSNKAGGVQNFEFYGKSKNGGEIPILLNAVILKDKKGNFAGNLGVLRDITERKNAEEALRESRQRFQDLVETLYDWIWEVDPRGHYTYVSPRIRDILGYEPEELLGKTPFELMPAEEAQRVSEIFRLLVVERKPLVALENINFHKDGHQVAMETSGLPFYDAAGIFKGYRGADRDITERKRAQEKLQAMNEELRSTNEELNTSNEELQSTTEELEAANEELRTTQEELIQKEKLAAVGQLASGVGHELRNPLGVIKNAAYYIKSKIGTADPKLAKHLDIMDREINNSNKIISDLLNFSRARQPELIPADVNGVIEEAVAVANVPENVRVNRNLTSGLPRPAIDSDQIKQVFLNMILNACQAMPQGGALKISSRLHKAGLKIEGQEKDCLEIEFADTGTGIAPENLKKMFDPFFTTKAKGIGLGLAVSRGIIEKHQGDIEVKSELNKGAAFIIKLSI